MGTQREPREDTAVEFVEVPLLSALAVAWGQGYSHAFAAVATALRNARFGFELHRPCRWSDDGDERTNKGFDGTLMLPPEVSCVDQMNVVVVRNEHGLWIDGTRDLQPLVVPSAVRHCRVKLNPASLEDDELRQLGLTRVTR